MTADQQTRSKRGVRRTLMSLIPSEPKRSNANAPDGGTGTAAEAAAPGGVRQAEESWRAEGSLIGGGTSGNERLTAATGILLVPLLAVIGVTLLRLRSLISVHLFVGLILIPPIALKMASTGYRFIRYYTASPLYRKRGAPPIVLRVSAPILVTSTVVVLATGVALLFITPRPPTPCAHSTRPVSSCG
jgi:hypothetical protein